MLIPVSGNIDTSADTTHIFTMIPQMLLLQRNNRGRIFYSVTSPYCHKRLKKLCTETVSLTGKSHHLLNISVFYLYCDMSVRLCFEVSNKNV